MNTGSSFNLTDKLLPMTYAITARAVLGEKCKDQEAYVSFIKQKEAVGVTNFFPSQKWLHVISGVVHNMKGLHRKSDAVLENIIRAATTKIGDGDGCLLSVLLNLNDHGAPEFQLTINNIKAVLQDVFISGAETSSTTLEWTFSKMLKNPRVLKRARAEAREVFGSRGCAEDMVLQELKFIKAVIKETFETTTSLSFASSKRMP